MGKVYTHPRFVNNDGPQDVTEYPNDPHLAAIAYAKSEGVPLVVRALCLLAAVEGGLGDGTVLDLSGEWAAGCERLFQDDFPDIDVERTLRHHLDGVCRVIFDIEELFPKKVPTQRSQTIRRVISPQRVLAVFADDDYRCVECGARNDLTVDHIVPVSKGGTDDRANLQTMCRPCNSRKGAR